MSSLAENPSDKLWQALEQAVGAQYTVLRLLGRGGMGAVYLARERLLERLVAIKVLPRDNDDAESRERFLREARTAASLNHPGIVPLHSFGELGDTLFYIMRFVDGESLEALLRREGALPFGETRRILAELSDALAYAHEQGVVHRDIKPDNVLLDRVTGQVLLTDFGVARQTASGNTLTGTGVIVGTPQYMSPEQASGDRGVDSRSDLYSVGLIGYRMLAGSLPFAGGSLQETLVQHLTKPPRPVTELVPDAPLDIARAVMKCLEKDPAARWQNGRDLRFAITTGLRDSLALPDELEGLPRSGTRMLGWGYVSLAAMASIYVFDRDLVWLAVAGISIAAGLGNVGLSILYAQRQGLPWRKALRIAFWPLHGWSGWWPRSLRAPGDVWERLPPFVKRGRIVGYNLTLAMLAGVTFPTLVLVFFFFESEYRRSAVPTPLWVFLASPFIPLLASIGPTLAMNKLAKRLGLTATEVNKLWSEPTFSSHFWERPSIAQLLTSGRAGSPKPLTHAALAEAVREVAGELDSVVGTIATNAVRLADDLSTGVRDLDAEYAQLNDPAAAEEQSRVADRLRVLGPPVADEPPAKRQMRELLNSQLALMADLESKRELVRMRRDLLLEQLRTLWLHLTTLQAQSRPSSSSASELSGRIRELCESIERRVSANGETETLIRQ